MSKKTYTIKGITPASSSSKFGYIHVNESNERFFITDDRVIKEGLKEYMSVSREDLLDWKNEASSLYQLSPNVLSVDLGSQPLLSSDIFTKTEDVPLDLEQKREIFENIFLRGRTEVDSEAVWSLKNIANRREPQLSVMNALLLSTAKAGEELGYFGCLYKITNVTSGECYIGQTQRPFYSRIKEHLEFASNYANSSKFHPMYASMNETGLENFSVQVVDIVWSGEGVSISETDKLARSTLNEHEKEHIARENSHYLKGFGYNRTSGGAGTTDINKISALVRDLRMSIKKHGVFSVLRQAYVLWLGETETPYAEIAKLAGYTNTQKVRQILDENYYETRGAAVRAILPYLNLVLESHVDIAKHFNIPIEKTLDLWAEKVVGTKLIYEALQSEGHSSVRPDVVDAIGQVLANARTRPAETVISALSGAEDLATAKNSSDVLKRHTTSDLAIATKPKQRKQSGFEI